MSCCRWACVVAEMKAMNRIQFLEPLRTTEGINRGNQGLRKMWLAKDEAYRETAFDLRSKG